MCGICGIYLFDRARAVDDDHVTRMRETMVHRGPDDSGNYVHRNVGLGHRRLSIVDLSGGRQPMCNEDGTVWISFNGEVYNHAELRPWLQSRGHVFRTRSDTEAIVHLYEEEGEAGFSRLIGMFAFALYDQRRNRVVLVRDRIGIKPLYYRVTAGSLLFGSEIKAILAHPDVEAEINWERVPDLLLYGSVYGAQTLFGGISELEPGHTLAADSNGVKLTRYWNLPDGGADPGDEAEQRARVKDLLLQAIRRRLMSDVPLGAFLSGGLDSSLLVAMMSELTGDAVKTFSIGFAEAAHNEFPYSRAVAERYRTDHTEITLEPREFFDALPRLVWHYDEPVALWASVPLYFISRATKGKATVILTGEGADELFLGYPKYHWAERHARRAALFQSLCPELARHSVVAMARRVLGPRTSLDRLLMSPAEVASSFYHTVDPRVLAEFSGVGLSLGQRSVDVVRDMFEQAPAGRDFLSKMTYMDFKTFLVTLLMKQDKMSMAASIESRVPFLDHEFVEYGYRLTTDRKLRAGIHKKILKDIAAEYLSHDLIHRPKRGFPVPVAEWFHAPATRRQFEEILLDPATVRRGVFNQRAIEGYLRNVADSRRADDFDSMFVIWNLINFELWQRTFIDGGGTRTRVSDVTRSEPTYAVGGQN